MQPIEASAPARVRETAVATRHNLAIQDVVAVSFHAYMLLRCFGAPESPDRAMALQAGLILSGVTGVALLLTRGELLAKGPLRAFVYRVGLMAPIILSYFQMRYLLPALQLPLADDELYAIDRAIFGGTTPAIWFAQFNERPIVEWISFFYYSYFPLMILCLIPTVFLDRGRRQIEMMMGGCMIATVGHVLYTLVPGAGPYATLEFEPLEGGFFWAQVQLTVANAGSQLDIFPSLHTAYPTFFALHAIGWRHTKPWKYVWPILAFIAANIWVATMFLRWHWFVDVLAGLALAFITRAVVRVVADREIGRGTGDDTRQPTWEPLMPWDR